MFIKKKINQHRRDFTAIYECEHCGATKRRRGYDDMNFHQNVVPKMKCEKCGETADTSTPKTTPDVPPGIVV